MKADKNFRMSKPTKRMLATLTKEERNHFKTMMIGAQLDYETAKKKATKPKTEE